MIIRKFSLNSDEQVTVKVVHEILNLFEMKIEEELPETDCDLPELQIENHIEAVAGNTTHALTERPGELPVVLTAVNYRDKTGRLHHLEQKAAGRGNERFQAGVHRLIKMNLYRLFRREFQLSAAPWGILHGVRPTKIVHRMLRDGMTRDEVVQRLQEDYEASREKSVTITDMAIRQQPFLAQSDEKTISIYAGIPFCLSRCLYCSFPANVLPDKEGIERFLCAFRRDLLAVKDLVRAYGFKVQSVYLGGGTPTSLPDEYFREVLQLLQNSFCCEHTREFTVEAGRPDSMSQDKLAAMAECGVTRVSCNPQTMQQRTLKRIGRNHTPEDIITMFHDLREAGIPEINMDLIIGLPGENVADVADTLEKIVALGPDDITLHSLALKRGSRLKMNLQDYELPDDAVCREMFATAMDYITKAGLKPYYLYRQGYMRGQLENVGCCRTGGESMYNIQIMEEQQTILGIGAAATSKVIDFRHSRLKSAFNAKDLLTYERDADIYIEKRRALLEEIYGKPET